MLGEESEIELAWMMPISGTVVCLANNETLALLPARSAPLLRHHPTPRGSKAQPVLYFGYCIEAQCRLYSLGRIPIHRPYKLWSGLKPQEVTKGYILASKRHLCSMLDTQFREFPFYVVE